MTEAVWLACVDPARMLDFLFDGMRSAGKPILPSDRKLRMFACACCRLADEARHPIAVEASHVAERLADGLATSKDRGLAYNRTANIPNPVQRLWAQSCLRPIASGGAFDVVTSLKHPGQAGLLRCIVGNPFRPVTLPQVCADPDWSPTQWACPWLTGTALMLARQAYEERPGRKCEKCCGKGKWKRCNECNGAWAGEVGPDCFVCGHPYLTEKSCPDCHGTGRIEDGTLDSLTLQALADALEEAGCVEGPILRHLRGRELYPAIDGDRTVWVDLPLPGPHVRGCWVVDLILGKE
jgi:hypothetical protein